MNFIKKENKYYKELDIVSIIKPDFKFNIYFISEEIRDKSLLNTTDYYYIKTHYAEWYIGKFDGKSFHFINNQGEFGSDLFVARKIVATTDDSLTFNIDGAEKHLPKPSFVYMEFYMTTYNLGKPVINALVEYVESSCEEYKLKVNNYTNTINVDLELEWN